MVYTDINSEDKLLQATFAEQLHDVLQMVMWSKAMRPGSTAPPINTMTQRLAERDEKISCAGVATPVDRNIWVRNDPERDRCHIMSTGQPVCKRLT